MRKINKMKIQILSSFLFFFFLFSCTENKPVIPCLSCDGSSVNVVPTNTTKKVLMEEFTGVRCVNCPQAQAEIKNLQTEGIFGEDLIVVSYHAGFFSEPYSDSQKDFRTAAGTEILNFLETPIGYPSGVVNRKQFEGERSLQLIQFATWGGFVGQALVEEAQVAIDLSTTYNETNRMLEIAVGTISLESISEPLNLTVLISEDDIQDVQLTPDGIRNDYAQTHTFRTMVTNVFGDALSTNLNSGERVDKNYTFTLPSDWVAENCSVVVFVHQASDGIEVLQVEDTKVTE